MHAFIMINQVSWIQFHFTDQTFNFIDLHILHQLRIIFIKLKCIVLLMNMLFQSWWFNYFTANRTLFLVNLMRSLLMLTLINLFDHASTYRALVGCIVFDAFIYTRPYKLFLMIKFFLQFSRPSAYAWAFLQLFLIIINFYLRRQW